MLLMLCSLVVLRYIGIIERNEGDVYKYCELSLCGSRKTLVTLVDCVVTSQTVCLPDIDLLRCSKRSLSGQVGSTTVLHKEGCRTKIQSVCSLPVQKMDKGLT